jgi:hypothetical protein
MRIVTTGIVLAIVVALAAIASVTADAKPCAKHEAQAKRACLSQHARDKQAWPRNITWAEVVKRSRPGELLTLRRIAECEQPGSGSHRHHRRYGPRERWHTAWGIHGAPARYQGAYGMFSSTYAAGAYRTKYPHPPVATPAQETAVAIEVMRRWGPSAWGCHR